jgi:hypothetical protein
MDRVDQLVKFGGAGQLRLSAAASTSAANPARIDFTFDLAYFESPVLPFRIPYPVSERARRSIPPAPTAVCSGRRRTSRRSGWRCEWEGGVHTVQPHSTPLVPPTR